ncbi:ABC transporter permease [Nesterenkonia sp. PF2B19]|uniref:ABC transporter permease n=1 Tax=unclassified Nesterenkonia TaxID=2629769 RepID=UPI000871D19A|nr:ABC transporter permease [Nesterenkonia sp. PF2B19]OSM42954.1 ABC transporter permease [Nesterenkonia sp. PF2B19]
MTHLMEALQWVLSAESWAGPGGLGVRTAEHLWYTLLALVLSTAIALPAGLVIGHTGRGRALAVLSTGAARALPTLGIITLAGLAVGIGLKAPMIAFVVLAVPSIIAGAYSGVEAVDRRVVDAARAQGLSPWQVLVTVEVPLGLRLILGGVRLATLQVIATATLAAYVGAGGLGRPLFLGLRNHDYAMMLGASLVVIAVAILVDALFIAALRILRRIPGIH